MREFSDIERELQLMKFTDSGELERWNSVTV
jgi:hypothetical protein